MDWTEKYRPKTLDGVIGNPSAVSALRTWADSWNAGAPEYRAAVLSGSPGIGKTTSALALAAEKGWDTVEMNASDQRNAAAIENIALRGSLFNSFGSDGSYGEAGSGKRKLIILDEADNFFGNSDRGAIPVVNELIAETRQPVILIVNDFYALSRKSAAVKNKALQIVFKKPQITAVVKALYAIAEKEGVAVRPEAMNAIAENANGDMRAAIRNLESLAIGRTEVTKEMSDGLSSRDSRTDIFGMMNAIFKSGNPTKARTAISQVDEEPGTKLQWIDENIVTEYPDTGDLMRGYEKLSKSAIYLGRVGRRQYFGFWSYASDLMSFGVSTAGTSGVYGRERMRAPSYLTRMSRGRGVRAVRTSLSDAVSKYMKTTPSTVAAEALHYLEKISDDEEMRVVLASKCLLTEDEVGMLIGKKPDSAETKSVMERAKKSVTEVQVPAVREEESAPQKPKAQRSLFDFR